LKPKGRVLEQWFPLWGNPAGKNPQFTREGSQEAGPGRGKRGPTKIRGLKRPHKGGNHLEGGTVFPQKGGCKTPHIGGGGATKGGGGK